MVIRYSVSRCEDPIRHVVEKLGKYLRQLGISEEDVIAVLREPEDLVYDTLTDRYIA